MSDRTSIPTFQNKINFKWKQCLLLARLWVLSSGSLMTPVLFFSVYFMLLVLPLWKWGQEFFNVRKSLSSFFPSGEDLITSYKTFLFAVQAEFLYLGTHINYLTIKTKISITYLQKYFLLTSTQNYYGLYLLPKMNDNKVYCRLDIIIDHLGRPAHGRQWSLYSHVVSVRPSPLFIIERNKTIITAGRALVGLGDHWRQVLSLLYWFLMETRTRL